VLQPEDPRRWRFGPRSLALIACLIAGCGDAARPSPLPQVDDRGGPVMAHPALVPIFFADDPDIDALTAFSQWIVTSQWLAAVGAEYRVGSGSVLGVVRLAAPAPGAISDGGVLDLLFAGLADGTIPRPAAGDPGSALYMVHFPAHTVVTVGSATSCVEFSGYHASARRGGVELAYAVLPSCPGFIADEPALAIRELVSSHELIEAATDPVPVNHPGFSIKDPINPWLALGAEVADLCTRGDASATWAEAGFVAQRSWSNAAAAAGMDPCVPGQQTPYFTVAASLTSVPRIRPGKTQLIKLAGYVSGADDEFVWQIGSGPAGNDQVELTLGRDTLNAQQTVVLVVGAPDDAVPGSLLRFFVYSKNSSGYQLLPMFAAVGDECKTFTSCEDCTARTGCGFCAATGRCEAQGEAGSADSACPASSFATWPGSCPGFCAARATCADCSSQPGCGWCGGATPHCVEADHDTAQPRDASCDYADWSFSPSYCPP
jgi:hypothetical protein